LNLQSSDYKAGALTSRPPSLDKIIGVSPPSALRTLSIRSGHYVTHEIFILRKTIILRILETVIMEHGYYEVRPFWERPFWERSLCETVCMEQDHFGNSHFGNGHFGKNPYSKWPLWNTAIFGTDIFETVILGMEILGDWDDT